MEYVGQKMKCIFCYNTLKKNTELKKKTTSNYILIHYQHTCKMC